MKTWIRWSSAGVIGLAVLGAATWELVLRPENASLPVTAGTGPHPDLPQPNHTLFPTVNVATPVGWAEGKSSLLAFIIVHHHSTSAIFRHISAPELFVIVPICSLAAGCYFGADLGARP